MEIPYKELSTAALDAVVEEFVLREGTEYGDQDFSLQSKVAQVKRQLANGEVKINFDPESGSCQIYAVNERDAANQDPGQVGRKDDHAGTAFGYARQGR